MNNPLVLVGDKSFVREPYWENMAGFFLQSLIAYVCLEKNEYPKEFRSLFEVFELENGNKNAPGEFSNLISEVRQDNPDSFAARAYYLYTKVRNADETSSCILSTVSEKLMPFMSNEVLKLLGKNEIDFKQIAEKKTALFVVTKDCDSSMEKITSVFFTQLITALERHADKDCEDHRLPRTVNIIIDDFGTQTVIPDFDKMISAVRSRNITLCIILQSVSQLKTAYGIKAETIIACCDTKLYFGGSDSETEDYAAVRADISKYDIMNMQRWKVWVYRRCMEPVLDKSYNVCEHPDFKLTGEYDKSKKLHFPVREQEKTTAIQRLDRIRFDTWVTKDFFVSRIRSIIKSEVKSLVCSANSFSHEGLAAYSVMLVNNFDYYFCLFERRKLLLDSFYKATVIDPLIAKFDVKPTYFVVVSFSGFTKEEIEYAAKNRILLVDRDGFNGEKGDVIINISDFDLCKSGESLVTKF